MDPKRLIDKVVSGLNPEDAVAEAARSTLIEASLSRLRQHMLAHDTGTITAFRNSNTREVNQKRNAQLKAELRKTYDVTAVRGSYIEKYGTPEAVEVGENVFFVVDRSDGGTLLADLRRLGAKFDQDSILFLPKGGEEGSLWGTNESGYPGMNQQARLRNPVFGASGEFMTKVRGRPFVLRMEDVEDFPKDYPRGFFGEWGRQALIDEK